MTATVEIDKLGRFVVPKRVRDALHLQPGDRLTVHVSEEKMVLEPLQAPGGLYERNGRLVFDGGDTQPDTTDIPKRIREQRERHAAYVLGLRDEP